MRRVGSGGVDCDAATSGSGDVDPAGHQTGPGMQRELTGCLPPPTDRRTPIWPAGWGSRPVRWSRSSAGTTTSTRTLRQSVEDACGTPLEDEDSIEVADVVLLWFRDGDGDLVDALVDALTNLGDGGVVWLLTPKLGRPDHVEPGDIEEAAPTAGLHATSSISACPDWSGTRLASPKGRK